MSDDSIPYEERGFAFEAACEALGVCVNTGLKLVRAGDLVSYRVGRRHIVSGAAIRNCRAKLESRPVASKISRPRSQSGPLP